MTIPHISFSPANLLRHLNAPPFIEDKIIFTTRIHKQCKKGQLVYLEGAGYAVCTNISHFKNTLSDFTNLVRAFCELEGFLTRDEFARELINIYKSLDYEWYVYKFYLIVDENGEPTSTLPKEDAE